MSSDFYHQEKHPYGVFSNFTTFGIELDGHDYIRETLPDAGDGRVVEPVKHKEYGESGEDGSGKKMLGKILMRVWDQLRN